ncbi:TPA: SCP2 sterol-binding domain-containing protein [Candidatus Bathyarchaeota archaeon]|nr:SCP2 sterol-binding domain-containing protein [Candidatus Bathyarchaeota archaeon]HIJ09055.1 SCP2 sterol-binding domain-containing protein [Candidatus Bathyarchaeota archaeon]
MTEANSPKEFFEKTLPSSFKPEKAKGIDVIVQVDITGPNRGNWTVKIKDQRIQVEEGVCQAPTLTIGMAESDFMDMVNSKLSGEKAFFTGKIKFKGNISLALKLKDIGFL